VAVSDDPLERLEQLRSEVKRNLAKAAENIEDPILKQAVQVFTRRPRTHTAMASSTFQRLDPLSTTPGAAPAPSGFSTRTLRLVVDVLVVHQHASGCRVPLLKAVL
jgi:hypothetical protein